MTSEAYIYPGLQKTWTAVNQCRISVETVINACAEVYGITPDQMKQKTRLRAIVEPRQIAMYLIRFAAKKNTVTAGSVFLKDHATVMHASRVVTSLMKYPEYRERYNQICDKIGYKCATN